MFEQIFQAILAIWGYLKPYVVVSEYESIGVLRLGHYNRTLHPGFHWKIPLIEDAVSEYTAMRTIRLQPQTCTTKDRRGVVVSGVVKYRLIDLKPYICGVVDARDVLIDVSMGAVLKEIRELTFEELIEAPPEGKVATVIRRQVSKFGIEIMAFTFTDVGLVRSIRLISHNPIEQLELDG